MEDELQVLDLEEIPYTYKLFIMLIIVRFGTVPLNLLPWISLCNNHNYIFEVNQSRPTSTNCPFGPLKDTLGWICFSDPHVPNSNPLW
jgi:hypothetical protein